MTTTTSPAKPKQGVVENTYRYQSSQGEVTLNLDLPFKIVRKLRAIEGDDLETFLALLDLTGDEANLTIIDELPMPEAMALITGYFEAFQKRTETTMGEFLRSPN